MFPLTCTQATIDYDVSPHNKILTNADYLRDPQHIPKSRLVGISLMSPKRR